MKAVHLSNQELRTALTGDFQSLSSDQLAHLDSCDECRQACMLAKSFERSQRVSMIDAPLYLIDRAVAIPGQYRKSSIGRQVIEAATLLFDSWMTPMPAGVRSTVRTSRRLRYSAPHCSLDLQVTRVMSGWDCAAKIDTMPPTEQSRFSLQVGRKEYVADRSGFVHWQSERPPRLIKITDGQALILKAEVVWSNRSPR